jgi:hypothetical protein
MSKRDSRIGVTPEQREALGKYQKDFQAALPHITELARSAKAMHQAIVDAPLWRVVENPKPEAAQDKPELWSVGHAKVNYVDHIKTTNDEGTQEK